MRNYRLYLKDQNGTIGCRDDVRAEDADTTIRIAEMLCFS